MNILINKQIHMYIIKRLKMWLHYEYIIIHSALK
jgi:hypothetical protein